MDIEITSQNILKFMNELIAVTKSKYGVIAFNTEEGRYKFLMQKKYVEMYLVAAGEMKGEKRKSPIKRIIYRGFEILVKDYVLDNSILFTSTGGNITDEMIKERHYKMSAE